MIVVIASSVFCIICEYSNLSLVLMVYLAVFPESQIPLLGLSIHCYIPPSFWGLLPVLHHL